MSNLYSGQRQQAMSPMYGMSQPQSGFIPGGSFDPYQGMGGYGGGFGGGFPGMGGGYSMFGSYNAMPDYTGGYMPGYGSQLPSQFGGGVSQFGGMSQFGGGFGGYGMQPMQPNVNDLFGQYMFGQYYGAPSFNPFQATSMFGAGGGRGFGGGQRRGSREQFGGMQQPGGEAGFATTGQGFGADDYRQMANISARQQSPFEGLELDIDALRAALGLSGQSPASPTAQITPSDDMSRGAAQAPPSSLSVAQPMPPIVMPQTPFDLNAFNQLAAGNLPAAPTPPPATQPRPPVAPPAAPTQPPVQIPPNLNLFVPGFAGLDQSGGRQVQAPVEVSGFAPPPTPMQQAPTAATPSAAAPSAGFSMADLFGSGAPTQQALDAERRNQALLDQQKNLASQRLGVNIPTGPQQYTTERVPNSILQAPQFAAPQAMLPETGGEGRFYTPPPSFGMSIPGTPVPPEVPTSGGRMYVEPPVETIFAQSMPTNQMPALPPSTGFQPLPGVSDRLAAAQEAALKLRRGGRG